MNYIFPIIFKYGWIIWLLAAFIALIFCKKIKNGPFYVKLLLALSVSWFILTLILSNAVKREASLLTISRNDKSSEALAAYVLKSARKTYLIIENYDSSKRIKLYLGGSIFGEDFSKRVKALVWLGGGKKLAVIFDKKTVLVLEMPSGRFPDKAFLSDHSKYARGKELEEIINQPGL